MEGRGVFAGPLVAFAFDGFDVQDGGRVEIFQLVEFFDQGGEVVAIDGAKIFQAEVFEDMAGREGVFDSLLHVVGDVANLLAVGNLFEQMLDSLLDFSIGAW